MTARVVDGKIAIDAELQEGSTVAILAAEESGFRLTAEEEEELTAAVRAIHAGNWVDGRQLLEELKRSGGR